jgi:hypothetical protein
MICSTDGLLPFNPQRGHHNQDKVHYKSNFQVVNVHITQNTYIIITSFTIFILFMIEICQCDLHACKESKKCQDLLNSLSIESNVPNLNMILVLKSHI